MSLMQLSIPAVHIPLPPARELGFALGLGRLSFPRNEGPVQTSNFTCAELNTNLGRPK